MLAGVFRAAAYCASEKPLGASYLLLGGRVLTHRHAANVAFLTTLYAVSVIVDIGRSLGHQRDDHTGGQKEALQDDKHELQHVRGSLQRYQQRDVYPSQCTVLICVKDVLF